jgi:crotonobetainyl-CoA:carnitine CoA-transferase CaiB-like acyl-CoA transferase
VQLVGRPELADEPWFASGATRAEHADELDEAVGSWIRQRTRAEVVEEFERADAAVAPIYDVADVLDDPQYRALESIVTVDDPELGPLRMQNVLFRLSETPGGIRHAGPKLGEHTREVLAQVGVDDERYHELVREGVTT